MSGSAVWMSFCAPIVQSCRFDRTSRKIKHISPSVRLCLHYVLHYDILNEIKKNYSYAQCPLSLARHDNTLIRSCQKQADFMQSEPGIICQSHVTCVLLAWRALNLSLWAWIMASRSSCFFINSRTSETESCSHISFYYISWNSIMLYTNV